MTSSSTSRGRAWHIAVAGLLTLCCILTVANDGRRAIAGLTLPFDLDQFRDVAAAQSVADGHPLRDPLYRGETLWYNPLMPATVALVSIIAKVDVPTAFVQSGPLLNILAPAALFVAVTALFGPWPAFLAVISLIFTPTNGPEWSTPTYSFWLFPATFGLTFFYLGLAIVWWATRYQRPLGWIAAGVAIGIAFLAQTAPALVLGICAVLAIVMGRPRNTNAWLRATLGRISLVVGSALLVAAPLVWSIVIRYHLHIRNAAPNNWTWNAISLERLPAVMIGAIAPSTLFLLIGGAVVARRSRNDPAARLVCTWIASCAAFFAYGLIQQRLGFRNLPAFLPNYHFFLYLRAAGHLLVGVGLWWSIESVVARLTRAVGGRPIVSRGAFAAALAVLLSAAFVAQNLAAYRDRMNGRQARTEVRKRDPIARAIRRVRAETPPDAVVLAWPDDSLLIVGPAGRGVIAVQPEFSNPYVDFDSRAGAQREMLGAFVAGRRDAFRDLAVPYGVTHVLLGPLVTRGLTLIGATTPAVELPQTGYILYDVSTSGWSASAPIRGIPF